MAETKVTPYELSANDGWIPFSNPTYNAASEVLFAPGVITGKISKGMKIKFDNGGSTKYFTIDLIATDGGGNNILILTSPDGSTVANSAITNTYYSTASAPQGWNNAARSMANAGSAGGTIYYSDINGIKRAWGRSASISVTGTGFQVAIKQFSLPSGFFTTVQGRIACATGRYSNTQYMFVNVANAVSTAVLDVYMIQVNGSNGIGYIEFEMIGT